ncbi:MAG: beta-galactosidase [Limnochordales bacterium]|nr:beta-galactosidase [Limnochordales bacterium]
MGSKLKAAAGAILSLGLSLLTVIAIQGTVYANQNGEHGQERGKAETVQEPSLQSQDGHFLLNGKPVFLLTGEFPYYRIPAAEWADRLHKVKAAGVQIITFYIPWNWHMPSAGEADFTGETDPSRNLVELLRLIQARGMYAIAKPGPFICAEVKHGGIPDWFTRAHPEAITLSASGRPVGFRQDGKPLPAYLHPAYVRAVKDWFERVAAVLREWQAPSGPLIAVQVENEIPYSTSELADPYSWGYNPAEIDLYREWLKQRYQSLERYNVAHQTEYRAWAEVQPPGRESLAAKADSAAGQRLARWLPFRDWVQFKSWYGAEVLRVYGELLREAGVTVPLYQNFLMLEDEAPTDYAAMGASMWVGVNYWLPRHPLSSYADFVRGLFRAQLLAARAPGSPLYAPEVNWGWGHEGEFDFLTRYITTVLNGVNIYPVVNGSYNPQVAGEPYSNSPLPYPGSAPIGAEGETDSAAYESLRRLAFFLNRAGADLVQTRGPAEVAIAYYAPYNEERVYKEWGGLPEEAVVRLVGREVEGLPAGQPAVADAWTSTQLLMGALLRTGVEFELVDLSRTSAAELARYKAVVFWSWDYLGRREQEALAGYVKEGGRLLLVGQIPTFDEELRPTAILGDVISRAAKVTVVAPAELGLSPGSGAGSWSTNAGNSPGLSDRFGLWLQEAGIVPAVRVTDLGSGEPLASGKLGEEVSLFRRTGKGGTFLFLVNRARRPQRLAVDFPDEQGRRWEARLTLPPGRVSILHLKNGEWRGAALAGFGGIDVTLTPLEPTPAQDGAEPVPAREARPRRFTAETNFAVWVRDDEGRVEILTQDDVPGHWEQ